MPLAPPCVKLILYVGIRSFPAMDSFGRYVVDNEKNEPSHGTLGDLNPDPTGSSWPGYSEEAHGRWGPWADDTRIWTQAGLWIHPEEFRPGKVNTLGLFPGDVLRWEEFYMDETDRRRLILRSRRIEAKVRLIQIGFFGNRLAFYLEVGLVHGQTGGSKKGDPPVYPGQIILRTVNDLRAQKVQHVDYYRRSEHSELFAKFVNPKTFDESKFYTRIRCFQFPDIVDRDGFYKLSKRAKNKIQVEDREFYYSSDVAGSLFPEPNVYELQELYR